MSGAGKTAREQPDPAEPTSPGPDERGGWRDGVVKAGRKVRDEQKHAGFPLFTAAGAKPEREGAPTWWRGHKHRYGEREHVMGGRRRRGAGGGAHMGGIRPITPGVLKPERRRPCMGSDKWNPRLSLRASPGFSSGSTDEL